MTLNFPAVANSVADWLYSKPCSTQKALDEMLCGKRAETQRWRRASTGVLDVSVEVNHGC